MPHDLSFSLTKPNVKPSKSHWTSSGCRSAISHFKENACFCARVVEIGGKLFIHDLVQTSVIKYEYEIKKRKHTKTYENWLEFSLSKGIQGCASQWSSNMGPHLYKAISFMRIPGCLQTVRGVHDGAWFSCSIQHYISIRVDFSPNALSSWLLLRRTSTDCSKRPIYSVNLSDWCDCFYLFLNTIVTHNASAFKHGPWPPPCPQPCTWRPNASDLSVQPWKSMKKWYLLVDINPHFCWTHMISWGCYHKSAWGLEQDHVMLDQSPTSQLAFVLTMIFECAEFSKAGKKWVQRVFACQLATFHHLPTWSHLPAEVKCGVQVFVKARVKHHRHDCCAHERFVRFHTGMCARSSHQHAHMHILQPYPPFIWLVANDSLMHILPCAICILICFYQFVDRPFTSVEAATAMTEQLTRSIAVPARRCLCGAAWHGDKVLRAKMLSIERRQGRLWWFNIKIGDRCLQNSLSKASLQLSWL